MSTSPESNNMVVTTTSSECDYTEFRTTKLQESLKSVYESSRIAIELSDLKKKLNSLYEVKNSLKAGGDSAASNMDLLNKTIDDLEKNLENKQKDMDKSQDQYVATILLVMENVSTHAKHDGDKLAGDLKKSLMQFGTSVKQQMDKQHERLTIVEQTKLDKSAKDDILNDIVNMRNDMEKIVQGSNKAITALTMQQSQVVLDRVVNILTDFNQKREGLESKMKENLTTTIQERVDELKGLLVERMNNLQQENNDFFKSHLPEMITIMCKERLESELVSTKIQDIIKSLPEFKALQENVAKPVNSEFAIASVADHSIHIPSFEAIKTSIGVLQQQIIELTQANQHTKSIVDTLRLPASAVQDPTQFDHAVAVKRMEEMSREVNVIYNHVKMIETMVNLKITGLDEQVKTIKAGGRGGGGGGGEKRKRVRTEDEDTITVPDDNDTTTINEEYFTRLTEVENKHQKLLDFILQCKDGVLDDLFPTRLEAAMAKIEQVLLNHQKFISFLIDPFTTASNNNNKSIISIPNNATTEATTTTSTLNPAMIDAIQQLVKAQAEEISLPLQKRIKLLEEKLEARSQQQ